MALVRGHDALTAVEIGEETSTTWGTAVTPTLGVPILGETLKLEREQFPKSREFGTTGAVSFIEAGRSFVRGEITVHPRYDAPWFNILLAHTMGDEVFIADEWLDGSAAGTNVANCHGYVPSSTIPKGLTIWVYKSGPDDSGYIDKFAGAIVTRMVLDQPEDDIARVTFEFIAKTVTTAAASSESPNSPAGSINLKARDLSNTNSRVKTGASYGNDFNVRSLRVTYDKRLEVESAFLNDPDSVEKPGVTDTRDVTVELNGLIEQNYGAAGTPWTEFLAKTQSRVDIRFTATDVTQGSQTYGWRLNLPGVIWEDVQQSIGEPGENPLTVRGRAISAAVLDQAGTDVASSTVSGTGDPADLRMFTAVKQTDDSDVVFSDY